MLRLALALFTAVLGQGQVTLPPRGFTEMCQREGCQALPAGGVDDTVLLESVNKLVNSRVLQITDMQNYGVPEYWTRSGLTKGDCEDIALEKRAQLIERGFDPSRLKLAVVYTRNLGLHVVLVAFTSKDVFILDSRTPYLEKAKSSRYSWVVIQDQGDNWIQVQR